MQAAPEGAADAAQDASLLSKSRSRRGEAAVKKGDVSGTLHHKSALSCFGLPQVADDDDGSLGDAGPPLIEVRSRRQLAASAGALRITASMQPSLGHRVDFLGVAQAASHICVFLWSRHA